MGKLDSSGSQFGNEKTEAEVRAVPQSKRALALFGECYSQGGSTVLATTPSPVVANGLELQRAQAAVADAVGLFAFGELSDSCTGTVWMQGEQTE